VRRRITIAMVLVTAGSLLVTTLVALALTVHAARTQTRHALSGEAVSLANALQADTSRGVTAVELRKLLRTLKRPLRLEGSAIVAISAGGTLLHPGVLGSQKQPEGVGIATLDSAASTPGQPVSGIHGTLVFAAVGFAVDYERSGSPRQLVAVVVLTRRSRTGLGLVVPWLAFSLIVVLLLALVVAWRLGRRLARPLEEVERVTALLAAGDLSARVDAPPGTDAELNALGTSVNVMATSLAQAQAGQRQFLLSVSHELRTPLTSIRGFAEALEDGAAEDIPRVGSIIGAEARRLERLVSDLLDLARLDTGQFSLQPRSVSLAQAVEAAATAFGPAATELGLELTIGVTDLGASTVTADLDRLGQIVGNLVENALKHATSAVHVGAGVIGGVPLLWVDDDGPGIAPGDLPHIFTRLFSSEANLGRRVGTGLGLAIVAELAAAMGAQVRAESPLQTNGGTRLVVVWPPAPFGVIG
jgi:two-component system OmpR family sensor kinase